MNLNQILNKNCIEGMKEIKNNSFDLILTDPPYQISKESQFSTLKDRKNARTGTYFGEWDENFDNEPWIKEASRVLKSGGSLLVFNDIKKISIIIEIAEKYGLQYKDTIIWKKTNPMPRNRDRRYVQDIESVIWFVSQNHLGHLTDKKKTLNPASNVIHLKVVALLKEFILRKNL